MKNIRPYWLAAIIQGVLIAVTSLAVHAEEATTDGYVTRKEYDELKAQMLVMKQELDALRKEREGAQKQGGEEHAVTQTHEIAPAENSQGQPVADMHKQVGAEPPPPIAEPEGSLFGTTK